MLDIKLDVCYQETLTVRWMGRTRAIGQKEQAVRTNQQATKINK